MSASYRQVTNSWWRKHPGRMIGGFGSPIQMELGDTIPPVTLQILREIWKARPMNTAIQELVIIMTLGGAVLTIAMLWEEAADRHPNLVVNAGHKWHRVLP